MPRQAFILKFIIPDGGAAGKGSAAQNSIKDVTFCRLTAGGGYATLYKICAGTPGAKGCGKERTGMSFVSRTWYSSGLQSGMAAVFPFAGVSL
ncbi:MAG TPA: hypothetical protein H9706_09165 [Candidatus Gemmiger stercorigallinarum]|nr:hypothetical protein [Candidatus Gemmiger stercorigallinarum]